VVRVLIIEDDPDSLDVVARIVQHMGHSVIAADNGREASGASWRKVLTSSFWTSTCLTFQAGWSQESCARRKPSG
jgi:DNA-binding NtrC family response regulator